VIPSEGSLGLEPGSIVKDCYKFISDVCRKYCYAGKVVMLFYAICGAALIRSFEYAIFAIVSSVYRGSDYRKLNRFGGNMMVQGVCLPL